MTLMQLLLMMLLLELLLLLWGNHGLKESGFAI
jgi:hypothetical protein